MSKSKAGFQIPRPTQPSEDIKRFAREAEVYPGAEKTAPIAESIATQSAETPPAPEAKFPWEGINDKAATVQYNLILPVSLHAKLMFLRNNEPGGPSLRKMMLDAMEPYVEERLKKYTK